MSEFIVYPLTRVRFVKDSLPLLIETFCLKFEFVWFSRKRGLYALHNIPSHTQ